MVELVMNQFAINDFILIKFVDSKKEVTDKMWLIRK